MAETGQRRQFSHLLSMCWKGWTLWWTYLALARLVHSQDQIKVLTSLLRLEDVGEGINGAKLINTLVVNVTDLTICIRFNLKVLGKNEGRSRIITIEDWREDGSDPTFSLLWLGAHHPFTFFGFGYPKEKGSYRSFLLKDPDNPPEDLWQPNFWNHVCLSFEKNSSTLRVIKDGRPMNVNGAYPQDLSQVVIPSDFLNKVYLGRCSFDFKKTCSTPEGELSDFNVWSRALSVDEMTAWTSCRNMTQGDLVNWANAEFDLTNMTIVAKDVSEICSPPQPGDVFIPERINFTGAVQLCRKLRGKVASIPDSATLDDFTQVFGQYPDECGNKESSTEARIWTQWSDETEEGLFMDINTGRVMNNSDFVSWFAGEPNGDILENCVELSVPRRAWNDADCRNQRCSFCNLQETPSLYIRGLCLSSLFDNKYSWKKRMVNRRLGFRGVTESLLAWDAANGSWKLELYGNKSVFGILENTSDYPFGNHVWTIHNDPCYPDPITHVELNVNACSKSEFNCYDGMCIPMSARCDGSMDCSDRSDENECNIIQLDSSYIKEFPPNPPNGTKLLPVNITIDILSILEIKEVEQTIHIQFLLEMTWFDKRLRMQNLKKDMALNMLPQEVRDQLWMPILVFDNTNQKETSLRDERSVVTVERRGNFTHSPRNQLRMAHVYQGKDNPITIRRVYAPWFQCNFDMMIYPFDTQTCLMIMNLAGNSWKFVEMKPSRLHYLGQTDLTQFYVQETTMTRDAGLPAQLVIKIVFRRRVLGVVLTTFLPTVMLCLVSFATNFFQPRFFEADVTVNLTSLLTLTTLFISVSNSLPKTSYLKMIEVWLIVTLIVPFSQVILHTCIDFLGQEDEKKDIKPVNRRYPFADTFTNLWQRPSWGRNGGVVGYNRKKLRDILQFVAVVSIPVMFAFFIFCYFMYGLVFHPMI